MRDLGRSEIKELTDSSLGHIASIEAGSAPGSDLTGSVAALMFFEPSTRTQLSFDLAAQRLGAQVISFNEATSSTAKGETLRDTVLTVAAMADVLVIRHSEEYLPHRVLEWTGRPVINAGDGTNEHPTQALADLVTLTRHFDRLDGLKAAIVGDIRHSRVAGSLVQCLPKVGMSVTLVGPAEMLPGEAAPGVALSSDLDSLLEETDVVYLLRVQAERGARAGDDYVERFQLSDRRAQVMKPGAVVMHPGPMNRGVEIDDDVADGPRSLALKQVANGVPARMAVLEAIAGTSG